MKINEKSALNSPVPLIMSKKLLLSYLVIILFVWYLGVLIIYQKALPLSFLTLMILFL